MKKLSLAGILAIIAGMLSGTALGANNDLPEGPAFGYPVVERYIHHNGGPANERPWIFKIQDLDGNVSFEQAGTAVRRPTGENKTLTFYRTEAVSGSVIFYDGVIYFDCYIDYTDRSGGWVYNGVVNPYNEERSQPCDLSSPHVGPLHVQIPDPWVWAEDAPVVEVYVDRTFFDPSYPHWVLKRDLVGQDPTFQDLGQVIRRPTGTEGETRRFAKGEHVIGIIDLDGQLGLHFGCMMIAPTSGLVQYGVVNKWTEEPVAPWCDLDRPRRETGEGKTLSFFPGDSVVGAVIVFPDGWTLYNCYFEWVDRGGTVTSGAINYLPDEVRVPPCL